MKHVLIGLIRGYQILTSGFPSPCRYVPSCSAYAIEAIRLHGSASGSWMALRRVLRCHPWHEGGPDPVPLPRNSVYRASGGERDR